MSRSLTRIERKIVALALLAAVLTGIWYIAVESWFLQPLRALSDQAETLADQHHRYALSLAQKDDLQAALSTTQADASSLASLFPGEDPNAVAADFMQYVVDQVSAVSSEGPGCEVAQRSPIVPAALTPEPYQQVNVSVTLDCGTQPLANLLHSIEYGQPSVFVDYLNIRRENANSSGPGPGRLKVQLLLRAYLQNGAGEVTTP